jgi:hypothetical protein
VEVTCSETKDEEWGKECRCPILRYPKSNDAGRERPEYVGERPHLHREAMIPLRDVRSAAQRSHSPRQLLVLIRLFRRFVTRNGGAVHIRGGSESTQPSVHTIDDIGFQRDVSTTNAFTRMSKGKRTGEVAKS